MFLVSLAGVLLVAGLAFLTRQRAEAPLPPSLTALDRALASRWIVGVIGCLTVAVVWWCWGVWHPIPVVQDEFAYVLQARIFASGHWTAPTPPYPAFFEQAHVLVVPALAAKYPPGHALVLAAGALVGFVPLAPLLLAGVSGALLFLLARRVANGAIALLAWVIWLSSPMVQRFAAGFYSESTTTACWLAGWLLLLEWRASGRRRLLVALALVIGLGAITRPLTMLVFAIPVGLVVLRDVAGRRAWSDLALAVAAGVAMLAVLPLWSARTTGHWNLSPLSLYTRQYMPWDVPGFGWNATPPQRALPPDLAALSRIFEPMHRLHLPETMSQILAIRAGFLARNMWGVAYAVMIPMAMLGLFTVGAEVLFALASAVLLVLAYMSYAAAPAWTLYYLEATPVLALLAASGVAFVAGAARRGAGWRLRSPHWRAAALGGALVAGTLVLAIPGARSATYARRTRQQEIGYRREFARILGTLSQPAVLFVRYAPDHNPHTSFVRNTADLVSDPVWVVYDRGPAENARLLALVPDRATYLYDEARRGFFPYDVTSDRR